MSLALLLNNPRAGREAGPLRRNLERSQWFDAGGLERLQDQKMGRILDHVRSTTAYYRDYRPWGDAPGGSPREKLASYPILTKDEIRRDPSRMRTMTSMPRSVSRRSTGGTTGEPIDIWRDRHHLAAVEAAYWRGMSWLGIHPLSRGVCAEGFGSGSWYGRLRMFLARKMIVDAFGKDGAGLALLARRICRFRPGYVTGFVTDVLALGHACHGVGLKVGAVVTTGEMLYTHQRCELKRLYGAPVHDYYGCNEVGAMAFECERGTKHVTDEHVILEVVNDHGTPVWDEPGRILLTDLDNVLTPLVRYEVGDIGVLTRNSCPCGRGLTVLESMEGRSQDALMNAAGARLSTLFFAGRFRGSALIHRLQLVQRTIREIDLLVAGSPKAMEAEVQAVVEEIRARLGPDMEVTPRQVKALGRTARGKCRLIIPLPAGPAA